MGGGQMIDCKQSQQGTAHPSHPTPRRLPASVEFWSFVWHIASALTRESPKSIPCSVPHPSPLDHLIQQFFSRPGEALDPPVRRSISLTPLNICSVFVWRGDKILLPRLPTGFIKLSFFCSTTLSVQPSEHGDAYP